MKFMTLATKMPALLDSGLAIELVSAPGRGKSEFVKGLIAAQSERTGALWGFSTLFLATQTPSELMGYMVPQKQAFRENGEDVTRTVSAYTMPPWMMTQDGHPLSNYKRGILFLDEYGQGDQDTKRVSAELLLNGRIGPWRLPKGWSVVAASNRTKDRSGVTKSFDFVINRRIEINISDDLESWQVWAVANKIHPVFMSFAALNPSIVFADTVPEVQGPWTTPRSLVMAAKLMANLSLSSASLREGAASAILPTDGDTLEMVAGLIGMAAAMQLFVLVRMGNSLPTYEEITHTPLTAVVPDKPDGQMIMCHMLSSRVDTKNIAPIVAYVERMPKEFGITFIRGVVMRDKSLLSTPTMRVWQKVNASLVSAISL